MGSGGSRMLDAVRDSILIVSKTGKIVYTNAAARGDFDGGLSGLLVQQQLRQAVDRILAGRDGAPVELKLRAADGSDAERAVSVVPAPNGSDAAVIVHAAGEPAGTHAEGRTVAELMRQHLHAPLAAFTDHLQTLLAHRAAPAPAAVDDARTLLDRLEKVMDMIAVFGGDALSGDERLLPQQLVEQAMQAGLSEALRNRVSIALVGFDANLPPVYGSERWLQRALREIIENAARHGLAAPDSHGPVTVEVRAHQAGEFLTLIFRNRGAFRGTADGGRFIPFSTGSAATPGSASRQATATRIGLPLAQRIVELHGGSLKLRGDDDNTEVVMQLPTGAPRFSSRQLDAEQARRYAEDLAKLMARRRGSGSSSANPASPAAH